MDIVKKIIDSGHLSVLEHCYASFDVQCSVRVLGQLTRHRHLSFTCKSARGSEVTQMYDPIKEEVIPFVIPTVDAGKEMALQDAAYWLPQGAMTDIVVTGNFRAWFEYLPKRLCKRAMPEHRALAQAIYNELVLYVPKVFDRSFMNCENCRERSCDFK